MSNQELETFIQRMDSNMLLYGQSIQHVGTTPQGEVEVRYIDPRSTVISGTATNMLSYDYSNYMNIQRGTGLEFQISQTTPRYYEGLTEDAIRQFMTELYTTTTTSYIPTPIIHRSKYHKYDIHEIKGFDNNKTTFRVSTPTKTFTIETKNKSEYNRALQDAQFANFKRWSHE